MRRKSPTRRAIAAAEALYAPSPERRQHGRITQAETQLVDARGDIGLPFHAEGLLGMLERRGDIGPEQRLAGEEFQHWFRLAALDPLQAADLLRECRVAGPLGAHGIEAARHRVNEALQALGGHGSPCGSCAWFVLGCEMSISEWAQREGWGGRTIRQEVAKGTLIGTLGVLAAYFGFVARKSS